jgi:hypothetical protein
MSDKFAFQKTIPGIEEPLWVTLRQEFFYCLLEVERNIVLPFYLPWLAYNQDTPKHFIDSA